MYERYRQDQLDERYTMDKKMGGSEYRTHMDKYYVDKKYYEDIMHRRKKTKRQNTKRGGKGKSKKTAKRGRKYKK